MTREVPQRRAFLEKYLTAGRYTKEPSSLMKPTMMAERYSLELGAARRKISTA